MDIHITYNMKTAYPLLTLLSVSLVAAGPLPIKRNDGLVIRSAFVPEPASVIARGSSNDNGAGDQKAAEDKAGSFILAHCIYLFTNQV